MGKTATLNIRVNPDVKENAESVLAQLGIPMATAIDMYLKQISLVGGIPFSIVLPKAANSVNADMMSVTQIHQKLEKGYADIEKEMLRMQLVRLWHLERGINEAI